MSWVYTNMKDLTTPRINTAETYNLNRTDGTERLAEWEQMAALNKIKTDRLAEQKILAEKMALRNR